MSKENRLCDDCMTVAYDHGFNDPGQQAEIMVTAGLDVEDHLCAMREEPEDFRGKCICACNDLLR